MKSCAGRFRLSRSILTRLARQWMLMVMISPFVPACGSRDNSERSTTDVASSLPLDKVSTKHSSLLRGLRAMTNALQPRTVLVYLDLSGSMRPAALRAPLVRLAGELRPRDRLVLYPVTAHTASELTPVFDSVIAGSLVDQFGDQLGLTTRLSGRAARQAHQRLADQLLVAERAAHQQHGRAASTSIIEAVCHAGGTAQLDSVRATIAIVITDGIEESPITDLSAIPRISDAPQLATRLKKEEGCDLGASNLTLRMIGVRHPSATVGLIRWWTILLTDLGYPAALDDVSTHRLRPLLSAR